MGDFGTFFDTILCVFNDHKKLFCQLAIFSLVDMVSKLEQRNTHKGGKEKFYEFNLPILMDIILLLMDIMWPTSQPQFHVSHFC